MKRDFVEKIINEFRTTEIPRYDEDNSERDDKGELITSRTYCNITPEHKERITRWLRCKLLGEDLIKNLK